MIRILLPLLLACLVTPLAAQNAPDPVVVRQSLEPATGAVIGQHVALRIDVLLRSEMPHPPRVGAPDVAGLQALRFETQGTTLRETIAGATYIGQRSEWALYARRGGDFVIPAASVTLLDRQGEAIGTAKGQAVSLAITVPQGVDPSGPVVATRELTLNERWAPGPKTAFKPGDAIVRTITRTAEDVPGLAMRDLDLAAPDGVRAYIDPPEIDDRSNRGVVTGRRVDRVTYVFERGGRLQLPSTIQPWWDLAAGTLKTANAAGATITVTEPLHSEGTNDATPRKWLPFAAGAAVVFVILGVATLHLRRRRRPMGERAEQKAFIALRRACSANDANALYRAFAHWRFFLDPGRCSAATQAATGLDAALFSGHASAWTAVESREFLARLASLRKPHSQGAHSLPLPPLNPGGEAVPNDASPQSV